MRAENSSLEENFELPSQTKAEISTTCNHLFSKSNLELVNSNNNADSNNNTNTGTGDGGSGEVNGDQTGQNPNDAITQEDQVFDDEMRALEERRQADREELARLNNEIDSFLAPTCTNEEDGYSTAGTGQDENTVADRVDNFMEIVYDYENNTNESLNRELLDQDTTEIDEKVNENIRQIREACAP